MMPVIKSLDTANMEITKAGEKRLRSLSETDTKICKVAKSILSYVPESLQTGVESKADFRFQLVEHASEGDLRNFLRRQNLSIRDNNALPDLGLQLLEKVKVLHDHGGAHRDIKPANLLVDTNKEKLELFIGDFGMYTTEKAKCGRCGTVG
ncbi:MAG: hypothetical protein EBZ47_08500, partial [Chlamydiae bacterium]|nr:hypothetical protein [Chlamydiota bacterium]